MNKVDSAFLVAAACGMWCELAIHNKDTFFGLMAGFLAMSWVIRAIFRWIEIKANGQV